MWLDIFFVRLVIFFLCLLWKPFTQKLSYNSVLVNVREDLFCCIYFVISFLTLPIVRRS